MRNFTFLSKCVFAALTMLAVLNMQSCSSNKSTVSCPDLHGSTHHNMALHWKMHDNSHSSASAKHKANTPDKELKVAVPQVDKINPVGTASLSADLPKTGIGMFKILTSEERAQAREAVSSLFVKRPMLSKMINKRLAKMDEKYPAPAESIMNSHGGLSTAEILAIVAAGLSITFFASLAGMIIGIVALIKIKREGGANWAKIISIVAIAVGGTLFIGFVVWLALLLSGGLLI